MSELTQDPPTDGPGGRRGVLRETKDSLGAVFANRNLRRIELAFAGSAIGDWAYATAVAVWAYGVGGAQAVGIWTAIRLALMAISAPFSSGLADKLSRKKLMISADLGRAVLVAAAGTCLVLDTPAAPIFVLATVTSLLGTPFLVAQRSMLPSLAERPEELTAANGTASTIDSLAFFVGPATGALLIGLTNVETVFFLNVATFVWSMLLVAGVHVPNRAQDADQPEPASAPESTGDEAAAAAGPEEPTKPGFLAETSAGFRTIAADRGLIVVAAAASVQTIVAGASAVFVVVMAVDILGTGAEGVGFLNSVLGVGSVLGGMIAISRAGRGRLGSDLAVGVVLWSMPLVLVTLWPSPLACFVAMALLGLGNPLVDVNMDTLVQRLTPDEVMGRVFGALEACFITTMAMGALVMPYLIEWLGLQWALFAIAVPVVITVLAGLPQLRALDKTMLEPAALALLRGVDIFAPLSAAALESLARTATEARFAAGQELLHEGGDADRFYVVERGLVEVTQAGRVLRREGPGEYFGEIGLLRDVPRTATITAVEDTVVQTVSRDDFLRAVSGHREARMMAETVATRRLAV